MRGVRHVPSHLVSDTGRLWTPSIWNKIPWDEIKIGQREGVVFFDDFINQPAWAADSDVNKYAHYWVDGTIGQGAGNEFGELEIITSTADNAESSIQTGGNLGGLAKFILQATAAPHTIAFECRIKKSSLTIGSFFVGLGEEGMAADSTIADGGTLVDKDYFGFWTPESDMDGCDLAYNIASGTGSPVIKISDLHTWVANAYVKLGFIYDYKGPNDQQIKIFKNGVLNSTFVTKANIDDTDAFPAGEEMALLLAVKNDTSSAHTTTMDWWRFAQVVNS